MSPEYEAAQRRNRPRAELELVVHHETDGAFIVSLTGERKDKVSLPKSQVDIQWKRRSNGRAMPDISDDTRILGTAIFLMPEWLAIEKGLV